MVWASLTFQRRLPSPLLGNSLVLATMYLDSPENFIDYMPHHTAHLHSSKRHIATHLPRGSHSHSLDTHHLPKIPRLSASEENVRKRKSASWASTDLYRPLTWAEGLKTTERYLPYHPAG